MSRASSPFATVGLAKTKRSSFDLSHVVKTAFDIGKIIPLPPIPCIPGDVHRIRFNGVMRLQPMLTPIFENLKLRFYSFFIPYRILFQQWEDFITKGRLGTTTVTLPTVNPASFANPSAAVGVSSLWDYFGLQVVPLLTTLAANSRPIDFMYRAYWMIWNDFFRIPALQEEVDIETHYYTAAGALPAYRNWQRDYFTSALPFAQAGVAPALPVFGSANAAFDWPEVNLTAYNQDQIRMLGMRYSGTTGVYDAGGIVKGTNPATTPGSVVGESDALVQQGIKDFFTNNNEVLGDSFSSVDINDLRLTWQLQVWMERNARAGTRYTEQLLSHYGVAPRDERLQRPEMIGGSVTNVVISEVVQTAPENDTETPQGTMSGHGLAIPQGFIGSYHVKEHGMIMNLVCVTPPATYQQGIARWMTSRITFDFPFPEFAGLGEQEIFNEELFVAPASTDPDGAQNRDVFGFTGQYNDYRYIQNRVTGIMHSEVTDTLDIWHMSRQFANLPELSSGFANMEGAAEDMVRPFAVQDSPPLMGIFSIGLDSSRLLPFMAEPSSIGV